MSSCLEDQTDPFSVLNKKFSICRKVSEDLGKIFPESKIHSKLASSYSDIIHTLFNSYSKVIDKVTENEAYAKSILS